MSDYGSTRTYRTNTTYRHQSAVRLWWKIGHHRSNSDTASVISRRRSNKGKTSNRLSVPYIFPFHISSQATSQANSPLDIRSSSYNHLEEDSLQNDSTKQNNTTDAVDESAVSDTFLEEPHESQAQDSPSMAERGMRQNDRAQILSPDDRRERPRGARNADTITVSTSTLTPEPSLFEACRELQRRSVKVSLPSGLTFSNTTHNVNTPTNNPSRPGVPVIDRITVPNYPEHLLNLPSEPSFKDVCLKTVLNAGASVEFIPRTSSQSLSASEIFTCEDCNKKFNNEQDWDTHLSREKSYCPYCDGKFECYGLLLKHSCNNGRV